MSELNPLMDCLVALLLDGEGANWNPVGKHEYILKNLYLALAPPHNSFSFSCLLHAPASIIFLPKYAQQTTTDWHLCETKHAFPSSGCPVRHSVTVNPYTPSSAWPSFPGSPLTR